MAKKRTKETELQVRATSELETDVSGYAELLAEIKTQVQTSQITAVRVVNRQLTELYWEIGKSIVQRQEAEGWGKSVVDRLAADLRSAFPESRGFSSRNIWRMRMFYLAYRQDFQFCHKLWQNCLSRN